MRNDGKRRCDDQVIKIITDEKTVYLHCVECNGAEFYKEEGVELTGQLVETYNVYKCKNCGHKHRIMIYSGGRVEWDTDKTQIQV